MLGRPVVAALNHVLASAPWARDRLRPFAGQHAQIATGPLCLALAVAGDGSFIAAESAAEPAVIITLPNDTPFRYLLDSTSVFGAAKLAGSAEFAEALAFVFRNLHWDMEADLAKVVGDIAAHRLIKAGHTALAWQKQAVGNAAANFAEYVGEEEALVACHRDIEAFCRNVDRLRDDLARLEKRIDKL